MTVYAFIGYYNLTERIRGVKMPNCNSIISDDKLVAMLRAGQLSAFTELSSRYAWLVKLKAGSQTSQDYDDLLQEGNFGLYLAAKTYNNRAGASFKNYAAICIANQIISAKRKYASEKNLPLSESLSIDSVENLTSSLSETPERALELKESYQKMMSRIKEKLSKQEYSALTLYLSGISRAEVEKKTVFTVKAYDNAMQRVRQKLKNMS